MHISDFIRIMLFINSFAPGSASWRIIFLRAPYGAPYFESLSLQLLWILYRLKQRKCMHNILVNSMCASNAPKNVLKIKLPCHSFLPESPFDVLAELYQVYNHSQCSLP